MTLAQFVALTEPESSSNGEAEGTEADWAMLAAMPIGG